MTVTFTWKRREVKRKEEVAETCQSENGARKERKKRKLSRALRGGGESGPSPLKKKKVSEIGRLGPRSP